MALDRSMRHVKEVVFLPFCRIVARYVSPMPLTLFGFILGLCSPVFLLYQYYRLGMGFWLCNRIIDGMDGTVARVSNKQSDLGGYIDIVCDFIIYALIPISLVVATPSDRSFIIVSLLEATFFVNAASQMFLASILEKRALGAKQQHEITSVTMPVGLIEGTETLLLISIAILFPSWKDEIHILFGTGVIVNIIYRAWWARNNLEGKD